MGKHCNSVEIQNSIDFYDDLFSKKNKNKKRMLKNIIATNLEVTVHADGTVGPCCNTVGNFTNQ